MEKTVAMVIVIILLASAVGAVGYFGYKTYTAQKAKAQQASAAKELAAKQAAEKAKTETEARAKARAEKERQRKLKRATIGEGEGVINAYARQLIDEPELVADLIVKIGKEKYDLTYKGDKSDTVALKKWANHKACILAIVSGYVEYKKSRKHGRRQIRVKKPGEVAYLFVPRQKDSVKLLDIQIYKKEAHEAKFGPQLVASIDNIGSDYKITFWSENLTSFEYVWTPKKHKTHKKQKK